MTLKATGAARRQGSLPEGLKMGAGTRARTEPGGDLGSPHESSGLEAAPIKQPAHAWSGQVAQGLAAAEVAGAWAFQRWPVRICDKEVRGLR